ncbi:zinc transporter ZIP5-like isoform X1 [Oncorhynchus keta]|uniref:zinc transporter ZIP5-like isoform X1 n=2 Tax=Oncorhynchus keta TaxID=8018 RepID=UPI0015FBA868|nr:zinc transporter ZIP5-like isoform X1 [Oncorhynchus keta]
MNISHEPWAIHPASLEKQDKRICISRLVKATTNNLRELPLIYRMSPLLTLAVGLFFCLPLLESGAGARLSLSGTMKTPWNMTDRISNGSRQEGSTSEHLDEAFEEQVFYLQRLFHQYGDNGTLTYKGLQKLLGSLGLGQVSVLEISHRGSRHNHNTLTQPHPPQTQSHDHDDQETDTPAPSRPIQPPPSANAARTPQPGISGSAGSRYKEGTTLSSDHGIKEEVLPWSSPIAHSIPVQGMFNSLVSNHPTQRHLHGNCLNVTQLLWNFGLGKAPHITPAHFTLLCPALLYQIESGVCLRHPETDGAESERSVTFLKALGWSSLALAVISLPSLLSLSLVPLLPPARLRSFLCPMTALAVGTLCGDALLHLLPHTKTGPLSSHSEEQDSILKGLCVLGGCYLLFIFESLLGLRTHYKKVKRKRKQQNTTLNPDPERELTALQSPTVLEQTHSTEQHSHGHSHSPHGQEQVGMGSLVWMVVMGDGVHNLTDGLAIGAAFSQSLAGGLSTTIAVFCHELPHELGDLAVLMGAGWPVRRLLIFSAVSALLGFVGLLIGSVLGHQSAHISPWILTLTAGVFLYVALADMLPEMLHGDPGPMGPWTRFLLQNLGLLAGGAIMLCIALFEDHIAFNLGDV